MQITILHTAYNSTLHTIIRLNEIYVFLYVCQQNRRVRWAKMQVASGRQQWIALVAGYKPALPQMYSDQTVGHIEGNIYIHIAMGDS